MHFSPGSAIALLHIIILCSHPTKPPLCASPRLFTLPNYALLKTPLIEDIHSQWLIISIFPSPRPLTTCVSPPTPRGFSVLKPTASALRVQLWLQAHLDKAPLVPSVPALLSQSPSFSRRREEALGQVRGAIHFIQAQLCPHSQPLSQQ